MALHSLVRLRGLSIDSAQLRIKNTSSTRNSVNRVMSNTSIESIWSIFTSFRQVDVLKRDLAKLEFPKFL